jgi:hypothetical protein
MSSCLALKSIGLYLTHCLGGAVLVAATAAFLVVAPAQAGPLVASAPNCDSPILESPFLPWLDSANYVLVPNGILESGRSWTLAGDAAFLPGNETYYVHGVDERRSLALPRGSSATTAPVCVGLEHPTLRFFARNDGSVLSTLDVEVRFEDAAGSVRSLRIAELLGRPGWQPTPPLPVVANLLPLLPGDRTAVEFRFRPSGYGDWTIDDIYVDPWRHG